MSSLTTLLWPHGEFRKILCCVCHRQWSEQLVATVLRSERRSYGSLCPSCLDGTPRGAALRIIEIGQDLTAAVGQLGESLRQSVDGSPLPTLIEDYRQRVIMATETTARLREVNRLLLRDAFSLRERIEQTRDALGKTCQETAHLVDESQRRRQQSADSRQTSRLRSLADSLEQESDRTGELLLLADGLSAVEHWSTTIGEMIALERETVGRQFLRPLSDTDLSVIVDNRYRMFLAQPA